MYTGRILLGMLVKRLKLVLGTRTKTMFYYPIKDKINFPPFT